MSAREDIIETCPFCLQQVFAFGNPPLFVAHDTPSGEKCAEIDPRVAIALIHGSIIDATFDGLLDIRRRALAGRPKWIGCSCHDCKRAARKAAAQSKDSVKS